MHEHRTRWAPLVALAIGCLGLPTHAQRGPLEHLEALAAEDGPVEPRLTTPPGLQAHGDFTLVAYLLDDQGELHSTPLWPSVEARVFELEGLMRTVVERELRLGPLHVRFTLHRDAGASHLEGTTLFLNSESSEPVGDVATPWLGLGVLAGTNTFAARYAIPHGVEPFFVPSDPSVSTWKLSYTHHLRAADMVPLAWVVSWGDDAYTNRLLAEPDHLRRRGALLMPPPELTPVQVVDRAKAARDVWTSFQFDARARTHPGYLFGHPQAIGAAGEQAHLGKHPALDATHPQVASGYASDRYRGVLLWVEGRRQYWLDWPKLEHTHPRSATNYEGLHFTSRWTAGYRLEGQRWVPDFGPAHGVTGYNIEHAKSLLPEVAAVTGDPTLLWMTTRLGLVLYNTLCTHPLGDGGYYGGGFHSLRGWMRPLSELMEVVATLESFAPIYAEEAAFLRAHVERMVSRVLNERPRFRHKPTRPDEVIPGHEGEFITETWQTGIGGDYPFAWYLYADSRDAFFLARQHQAANVEGWRGTDFASREMAKQALAVDWSVGRAYSRRMGGLVSWERSLLSIPCLPKVDQELRRELLRVVDIEFPEVRSGKWGNGPWEGFEPVRFEVVRPWFMEY